MSVLSKKVLIGILLILFSTYSVFGFESLIVETGGQNSASYQFIEELGKNWTAKYMDSKLLISAENGGNFSNRFESLKNGYARFTIAPIHYLKPEVLGKNKIKLVTALWNTYIAPLSDRGTDVSVEKKSFQYWMGASGSLLMQHVMKDVDAQPFGSDDYNSGNILVDENGFIVESATKEEASGTDQLILVESQQLHLVPGVYSNFVMFYDMAGSVSDLFKAHDLQLNVLGMSERVIKEFMEKVSWLRTQTINVPGQKSVKTVGFQMGLFCKAEENSEQVQMLLDVLSKPLIKSYMMQQVQIRQTSRVSDTILHSESIRFFR